MSELDDFSAIVEGLYRSAIDPAAWKYADETFERFLRRERDRETEERRAEAMDSLLKILAEAVLDDLEHEHAGLEERPSTQNLRVGRNSTQRSHRLHLSK